MNGHHLRRVEARLCKRRGDAHAQQQHAREDSAERRLAKVCQRKSRIVLFHLNNLSCVEECTVCTAGYDEIVEWLGLKRVRVGSVGG